MDQFAVGLMADAATNVYLTYFENIDLRTCRTYYFCRCEEIRNIAVSVHTKTLYFILRRNIWEITITILCIDMYFNELPL